MVSKWYESILLQGNFSKYQVISFGPKNKSKELNIVMMNSTIERHPEIKLLGMTIDDKLNFMSHVSNVCKKASRQVGVISRLRNMIPTKAKLQIYKSAILPHLTYCQTVWHFCCSSDSRKVERVQERGLRRKTAAKTTLSTSAERYETARRVLSRIGLRLEGPCNMISSLLKVFR